jgi:hypothetical protein
MKGGRRTHHGKSREDNEKDNTTKHFWSVVQQVLGLTFACQADLTSLINNTETEAALGKLLASCPHACACHHLSLSKNLICTPSYVSCADSTDVQICTNT